MGIDRIGGPSGPVPTTAPGEISPTSPTTGSVAIDGVGRPAEGSDLLGKLERGEISKTEYLDQRVQEAVQPFAGALGPERLDFMRATLRERLNDDPVMVELVRRASVKAKEP